jgi:serine/threonine protein phosphatase PrpC
LAAGAAQSQIFTDQNMAVGELLTLATGQVALYSSRSPDKDGPNEDGAVVAAVDSTRAVLAVADGLGGHSGGATAADAALHCLKNSLAYAHDDPDASHVGLRGGILDGIERGNQAVIDLGIGAATTLAVAEICGQTVRPYHVGDSAILISGQRGRIKLQTLAHSPVAYAVEAGMLDEDEALHHEERHLISNMVGAPDMRIEVGSSIALGRRDTLLLATDGLMDNMTLPEIVETIRIRPLETVARELADVCRERMREPVEGSPSKPDDMTFILYRRSG